MTASLTRAPSCTPRLPKQLESKRRQVLFAQDVHAPLHPMLLSNRSDYQASLRRLKSLDADIPCEGHHGIFVGRADIAAFIDRFIED